MPPRTQTPIATVAPALDRLLSYRLHRLHKLCDQVSQQRYAEDVGLPLAEGRCLGAIGHYQPMSVRDLARAANLDKGQASRAAQALVARGLVRKADAVHDGRGVTLSLSAAGRRAWNRTMTMLEGRNADIFGCLSDDERAHLGDLLDRLIAHNLRDRPAKPGAATTLTPSSTRPRKAAP